MKFKFFTQIGILDHRAKAVEKIEKIQQSHNRYLIALKEFNEYLETYSTILFPNLFKAYQEIQETLLAE